MAYSFIFIASLPDRNLGGSEDIACPARDCALLRPPQKKFSAESMLLRKGLENRQFGAKDLESASRSI